MGPKVPSIQIENHHMARIQEWPKQSLFKTTSKRFEVIWSAGADHITSDLLKTVFHKFSLVHS